MEPSSRGMFSRVNTKASESASPLEFSLEDPARLRLLTKRIYPDVARRCHTTSQRVERNIRTVSGTAWDKNRPLLLELAGFPLARRPNNASFLAILMGACVDSG